MKTPRNNDVQAAVLDLVKARIEYNNPDISRNRLTALRHKYGEGTLSNAPIPATIETGGLAVLTQLIAPAWDAERGGVYIPLLNLILQPKNLATESGEHYLEWEGANALAKAAGGRLFTKEEAHLLYWQKDAINAILKEHDGELLDGYFWSSSECYETGAWVVNFSSGYVDISYKFNSNVARAVVAL